MISEKDQASGHEPIPRYPGSVMVEYGKDSPASDGTGVAESRIYIEYETTDRLAAPILWYKDQMEKKGWRLKACSPPVIKEDTVGTGFITLVYEKENKRCDIGTKYRPTYTKIWISHMEF